MENNKPAVNASGSNFGAKGWAMIGFVMLVYFVNCLLGSGWQIAATCWEELYGWNSTVLLSANSYGQILSVVTGLILGRLMVKKVDPKVFTIVVGALVVIFTGLISYAPSYIIALLLIVLTSCFVQNWAYTINPIFIANWFPRKKGVAMGWATIGVPLGGGLSATILYAISQRSSIHMGMWFISLVGVVAIIIAIVFVTTDPTKRNYSPDNDKSLTFEAAVQMRKDEEAEAAKSKWTFKRVVATKEVWFLALALGIEQLIASGNMMCMVPRLTSTGYDTIVATRMIMASSFIACPCSYLMGFIDGKIGPKKANIICICVGIVASIAQMIGTLPAVIVSIVCLGVLVGGVVNFAASVVVTYWGRANFTNVYSIFSPIIFLIGGLGSAVTMGIAAAANYNYTVVSGAFAIMLAAALVLFLLAKNGFVEKREEQFTK